LSLFSSAEGRIFTGPMKEYSIPIPVRGYEYNPTMLADYIFPWGTPGNTDDGIKLASEVGAALGTGPR
jgi:hypothetical protein